MNGSKLILLVDDNKNDQELIITALRKCEACQQIDTVLDGTEAVDYLFYKGNYEDRPNKLPGLILLDIKMPKMSGIDVLKVIKADELLRHIPVVMFTSSEMESDVIQCYDLGANAYVVKPINFKTFQDTIRCVGMFWSGINVAHV